MGRDRRFAVVPGPSGSGTSSHLRAGLIPRLRAHITRRHSPAVLRVLTPGAKPAGTYGRLLTLGEDDPEGWVIVVGSRKFSPCAVIPRSAPASSTCCWPQVIETVDRVWLWRSGPTSTPGARSIPDRGLSPTRTPRPATPRPRRAADPRHDERLRLLSKADVAEDQLPACTPRSARPRGPHRRGDGPLHPRGDHRPHRPGHGAAPVPGHRTDPPAAPPLKSDHGRLREEAADPGRRPTRRHGNGHSPKAQAVPLVSGPSNTWVADAPLPRLCRNK